MSSQVLLSSAGTLLRVVTEPAAVVDAVSVRVAREAIAVEKVLVEVVQIRARHRRVRTVVLCHEDRVHEVLPRPPVVTKDFIVHVHCQSGQENI